MQATNGLNSRLFAKPGWGRAAAPAHKPAEPGTVAMEFYMCLRCFEPADAPSPCPRCGRDRAACRPGTPDDPARRPPVTPVGEIRSRAPLWWLQASAAAANR